MAIQGVLAAAAPELIETGAGLVSSILGGRSAKKANKRAAEARRQALAQARKETEAGYTQAEGLLRPAYEGAISQKKEVAGQIGTEGQSTFNAQQELWAPWMVPGLNAAKNLDTLLNDPEGYNTVFQKYAQSPQFKFKMDEATKQLRRQASASGNRFGGAQTAALMDRSQQVAGQEFNSWLDRLQQQAQMGFQATGQISNARDALGQTKIGALQYGDTGALDIAKGQQLGELALGKSHDLANLTLGAGGVEANSALAKGQLYQGMVDQLGQLGGFALGAFGKPTTPPAVLPQAEGFTGGALSGGMRVA